MENFKTTSEGDFNQKALLKGILENDETILRSLYNAIFPKVRTYVLKNNGDEALAKDIFQEAFVACWKNVKDNKFLERENGNVEAYLFTIAKNKWTDFLRSAQYKKTISHNNTSQLGQEGGDGYEEGDRPAKLTEALALAFGRLGENCRELLTLFYFQRKSMEEISKKLNIGAASTRNKKYRCMEKLRRMALEIKKDG